MFVVGGTMLFLSTTAKAQFGDVTIDPALGMRPVFGPGGYIGNGFGYGVPGPNGPGYMPGLYLPPNDLGNGPSPYYSPIFSAMAAAPNPNAPDMGPAGWKLRPSLPFTGKRNFRLFRR
jgi:hypothetical protein